MDCVSHSPLISQAASAHGTQLLLGWLSKLLLVHQNPASELPLFCFPTFVNLPAPSFWTVRKTLQALHSEWPAWSSAELVKQQNGPRLFPPCYPLVPWEDPAACQLANLWSPCVVCEGLPLLLRSLAHVPILPLYVCLHMLGHSEDEPQR